MQTAESEIGTSRLPSIALRVAAALLQAGIVYFLLESADQPVSWPATVPALFSPLLLVAVLIPQIVLLGVGHLHGRPLALWTFLAALAAAGLGYHDAARGGFAVIADGVRWPRFALWVALSTGLFIANILVTDALLERRLMPSYPRHFDTAWKQGTQLVFAALFIGVFWTILHLGAALFALVRIDFPRTLIHNRWFYCPATALAAATALHLTDVQPALLRGARTLALTLFSWLLPLLSVLVLGFLLSLPFVSLQTLWQTHFASSLLLTAQALLIFLLNCAYQDGKSAPNQRVKRLASVTASLELPFLAGLTVWGLALRVHQYGWSESRLFAAALTLLASAYALGYAASVLRAPILEKTNFLVAYLALALLIALFTPVADPARIMVADQLERLKNGTISVVKFDFAALKFDGARWGYAALQELRETRDFPGAELINEKAAKALSQANRFGPAPVADRDFVSQLKIWPAGHAIPAELADALNRILDISTKTGCARSSPHPCVLRFMAFGPENREAALFAASFTGRLFIRTEDGEWKPYARLTGNLACPGTSEALAGESVSTAPHSWPDLMVGNQRFTLVPDSAGCP